MGTVYHPTMDAANATDDADTTAAAANTYKCEKHDCNTRKLFAELILL